MRYSALGVLFVCALRAPLAAQVEADRSKWGGAFVSTGAFADHRWNLFEGEIAPLTRGSRLLAGDLSEFQFTSGGRTGGTAFTMAVSWHPFQRAERRGPELRAGFISANDLASTAQYDRTTTSTYDTLVSTVTGERFPVDSIVRSSYSIQHRYRLAGLHASFLWRTKGRLCLFGGIGLGAGVVHDALTTVRYSLSNTVTAPGTRMNSGVMPEEEELFQNGTGSWFQWHIPLGLDYRVHRSHELWSRVHLFHELAPQMLFVQRPALRDTVGTAFWVLFGARITL